MSESHVVSSLVAKRSELSGLLFQHQQAIQQLSASIVNIDGAIKLFDPDYDLRTIKIKAPRQANTWFEHGEVGRMILDALRTSTTPLSTRQIGEIMIGVKGIAADAVPNWDSVLKPIISTCKRLEKKDVIKLIRRVPGAKNGAMLWELV